MKVMKKLLAMLLAACLLIGLTGVGAKEVRADDTLIRVEINNNLLNNADYGGIGWFVHYWGDGISAGDASLNETATTEIRDSNQNNIYTVFTTVIPAGATGYKVFHKKDETVLYFGADGVVATNPVVVIYLNGSDRGAYYTNASPAEASGFYLVGSSNDWSILPEYKLTRNPDSTDNEYMIRGLSFNKDNQFKIVYSPDGTKKEYWYPAVGDNYSVTESSFYNVYFRPYGNGGDGWHLNTENQRYIYAAKFTSNDCVLRRSLSLESGDISSNYYVWIPEDIGTNEVTVTFTWGGQENPKSDQCVINSETYTENFDGKKCYRVFCHVPAAEIVDTISMSYALADGISFSDEVGSIRDCAVGYLTSNEASVTEKVKAVAAAILNYGAACQKQFEYKDGQGQLATDGLDINLPEVGNYAKKDIKIYKGAAPVLPNKLTIDNNLSGYGLEYVGYTLLLQSKITLRVYFKTTESFNADPCFFCGDVPLDLCKYDESGVYRYVDIRNIKVSDLDVNYELKIAKDGNGEKSSVGSFSGLSYMALALRDADATLKNTVCALYDYYKAAETWLES